MCESATRAVPVSTLSRARTAEATKTARRASQDATSANQDQTSARSARAATTNQEQQEALSNAQHVHRTAVNAKLNQVVSNAQHAMTGSTKTRAQAPAINAGIHARHAHQPHHAFPARVDAFLKEKHATISAIIHALHA